MIIAHVGLDGSGKSAGMTMDAGAANEREAKKKNGKQIWCLGSMKFAKKLTHPLQILYLTNSIIYLDELQRFYPSDHTTIDEVTHHIISTHRHDKNVIHWSSQDWMFVHPFWRRETSYCWRYRPLLRDPFTGESRIHRHRRTMVRGTDMELHRREPDILQKKDFWITKKLISQFDSYEKLGVEATDFTNEQATMDLIARIKNPHYQASAAAAAQLVEDEVPNAPGKQSALNDQRSAEDLEESVVWEDPAKNLQTGFEIPDPSGQLGG